MVLVKIFKVSFSLFFFSIGLNIVFDFVLEKKQGFLDYKSNIRGNSKNWDFFKGVNPWFWSTFLNFLSVSFSLK